MKQKRVSEFLTEDEISAVLRVPDRRTLQGKRDYALLLLMFSTGLRKAEVCNLRVADITTYRNQPVVDVIDKGMRHRRVALNRDVMEAVLDYQKAFLPLTPSKGGQPLLSPSERGTGGGGTRGTLFVLHPGGAWQLYSTAAYP